MKSFFNLFSDAIVSSFGWMLVHSLWQGALLVLIASIGLYLFRKSHATVRYNLGILTLSAQVISSLATFAYYYFNSTPKLLSTALKNTAHNVADWKTLTYELSLTSKIQLWLTTHIQELVICWLIGAAVLVVRFLGGWIYTEYLRHNSRLVMNKEWRARFGILTAKLKVYQSIELKESSKILTPMVIGTLQPVVLIPIGLLLGFPTAQIEAILAHELAHIRRHDYLVNMLQSFVEVVFFFHPALWWLSERVRVEREHCCDDLAIEACGDRLSLAHALVGIAEFKTNHSLAMAFASKKPLLLQRVKRVLGVAPQSTRIFGGLPVTMLFIAALIGVSVYAVGQDTLKKKKAKAKTHQVAAKRAKTISMRDENGVLVAVEPETDFEIPEIDVDIPEINENINININEDFDEPELSFMNDSLKSKMSEFHQKMGVLQKQMEPLQTRMHELQLEMEKRQFDMEHFDRDREKLEWKKDNANEIRQGLLEKRSNLLHPDIKSKTKLNEADLEKQLADFEQQIKAQEQVITKLNSDLANNLKEAEKAGEPYRDVEKEMDQLNGKIDEIGKNMGLASLGLKDLHPAPPRPPKAPKAPAAPAKRISGSIPPPPPPAAPKSAPVSPKSPPSPPAPPIKK